MMIGKTISHYKILEKLGEGGMAIVYKAEDTKLKRAVALKFLPPELTRDPKAKNRFVREAQAASALDHPNIGTVYEINETDKGRLYIVMACYEGETLRQKVDLRPLPIKDVIDFAIQVAEGLAKAHQQEIIHRDIKPGNVIITQDGRAKILDFGLAKLLGQSDLTTAGTTLGTISYMSPEQLRGEQVDHRTDIWSFGVLLYEMLTGHLPFKADHEQAVAYSIQHEQPEPITAQRTGVPMELERIVNKAMAKSRDARYQHVDEMSVDLKAIELGREGISRVSTITQARTIPQHSTQKMFSIILSLSIIAVLAIGTAFWGWLRKTSPVPGPVIGFEIPIHQELGTGGIGLQVTLSPDGMSLVYVDHSGLVLRSMDQLQDKTIPGTERGFSPFFSPDGNWIGFIVEDKLRKVALTGGPSVLISDVEAGTFLGASWGPDDRILFSSPSELGFALVSAKGGKPQVLPKPGSGQRTLRQPEILPTGKAALCTIWPGALNKAQIGVVFLETGEVRVLLENGTYPRYAHSGHLVYALADGTLLAAPFDLERLEVTGASVPIIENIMVSVSGGAEFTLSQNGSLAYVPAGQRTWAMVMVDRQGKEQLLKEVRGVCFKRRVFHQTAEIWQ